MTEPRYLRVDDIMAILQCGRSYAYELIERLGRANCPGLARVSASKFYEYLESRDRCASSENEKAMASGSGGRRGRPQQTSATLSKAQWI